MPKPVWMYASNWIHVLLAKTFYSSDLECKVWGRIVISFKKSISVSVHALHYITLQTTKWAHMANSEW